MKHIVQKEYRDLELKRLIIKGAVLEEEYKKDGVELTEERINYLTNERKLCIAKEDKEDVKDNKDEAQTKEQDDTNSKTKSTKKEDKNN